MKDRWLKKLIRQAHTTKLTVSEKKKMLASILGSSRVPSPYYFYMASFVRDYHRHAIAYAVIFALVITSGGTSYAAADSLPGEALYSIKTNVNEEIQNFVALTPDARARFSVERTGKRLEEAEKLSKKGKLTTETKNIIETKIKQHTDSIKQNIVTLSSENATATVQKVVSDLTASIEVHQAVLSDIASSSASSTDNAHIDEIISTIQEVKTEIAVIGDAVAAGTSTPGIAATSTVPVVPETPIVSTSTPAATGTEQTLPSGTSSSTEPGKLE